MEILFSNPPSSRTPLITRTFRFSVFHFPQFTLLFVAILVFPFPISGEISYADHCSAVLPDPPLLPEPSHPILTPRFLYLKNAYVYFNGSRAKKGVSVVPRSLSFSSHKAYKTRKDDVFKIEAVLTLIGVQYSGENTRRGLRLVHFRPPRIPVNSENPWNSIRFLLNGFWDSISGKLCMVGSGTGKLTSTRVVLKLDYVNSSNIFCSLVNGTFESMDVENDNGVYLNSISILGVNLKNYRYEMIDKEIRSNGYSKLDDMLNVSFGLKDLGRNVCAYIRFSGILELEHESDCGSGSCNFLGTRNSNFTPRVMYFDEIMCLEDGQVRFLLGFGDFLHNAYRLPFQPNVTLISEGKWDEKQRRLNMVACHISTNSDEGFVRDCSIRLSLRFPAKLTLHDRSTVVGELWSSKSANESGYYGKVLLSSMKNKNAKATSLGYEYTEIEKARRFCASKTTQKGGQYPDSLSSDMRFDMAGENKRVKYLWGYSSPFFVDKQLYQLSPVFGSESKSNWQGKQNFSDMVNVSYILSLSSSHDFQLSREDTQIKLFEISAEGTYDAKSGHLCMIGCLEVGSLTGRLGRKSSLDCEVLVDIQYPPLHVKNGHSVVKGTIESMRDKSDRRYFEPFTITARSIYTGQAKESIWRLDFEITMVLISSTLSCIFTGLQLLHVKNNADVLPFISIVMLALLTLGHLIPLLLNFEALFMMNHNNLQNVQFGSDGWLEVNEVFVRVITMVAFMLEFRLLQMTWSARSGDSNKGNLWISHKKVLHMSLPLYVGGGLIAWFVHILTKSHKQHSLWGGLKSYGGLILDGFLLPQTLFNLLSDSNVKALAHPFYIGTTLVRLLPHVYDLYRSNSSIFLFNYIYANPRQDYYSTAWDLIISTGGLVFVVVIYLQQRYGGRCLLLKRLWERFTYEKVPASTTV